MADFVCCFFTSDLIFKAEKVREKSVHTASACSIRLEYSRCEWTAVYIILREVNLSFVHYFILCSRHHAHLLDSLFIFALRERHYYVPTYHFSISSASNSMWIASYDGDFINFILFNFQQKRLHTKLLWISIAIFKLRVEIRNNTTSFDHVRDRRNSLDRQFSYNFMIRKKLAINSLFSAWLHFLMSILSIYRSWKKNLYLLYMIVVLLRDTKSKKYRIWL